jgi:hypothetical protein
MEEALTAKSHRSTGATGGELHHEGTKNTKGSVSMNRPGTRPFAPFACFVVSE